MDNKQSLRSSEEDLKKIVLDFEEAAWNQHDVDKALTYLASNYKQHNPYFADGVEGFKAGLTGLIAANPNLTIEIKRTLADGDYVIIHKYAELDSKAGTGKKAIMDIYRMEDGKIAEHWDVLEDIPEEPKNTNTMF
jgi:predicted SnoaL-like aldol condensation-catalyzing enzyme